MNAATTLRERYEMDAERIGAALKARREGAECCDYRSFEDYGNSARCVLVKGHEGGHIV